MKKIIVIITFLMFNLIGNAQYVLQDVRTYQDITYQRNTPNREFGKLRFSIAPQNQNNTFPQTISLNFKVECNFNDPTFVFNNIIKNGTLTLNKYVNYIGFIGYEGEIVFTQQEANKIDQFFRTRRNNNFKLTVTNSSALFGVPANTSKIEYFNLPSYSYEGGFVVEEVHAIHDGCNYYLRALINGYGAKQPGEFVVGDLDVYEIKDDNSYGLLKTTISDITLGYSPFISQTFINIDNFDISPIKAYNFVIRNPRYINGGGVFITNKSIRWSINHFTEDDSYFASSPLHQFDWGGGIANDYKTKPFKLNRYKYDPEIYETTLGSQNTNFVFNLRNNPFKDNYNNPFILCNGDASELRGYDVFSYKDMDINYNGYDYKWQLVEYTPGNSNEIVLEEVINAYQGGNIINSNLWDIFDGKINQYPNKYLKVKLVAYKSGCNLFPEEPIREIYFNFSGVSANVVQPQFYLMNKNTAISTLEIPAKDQVATVFSSCNSSFYMNFLNHTSAIALGTYKIDVIEKTSTGSPANANVIWSGLEKSLNNSPFPSILNFGNIYGKLSNATSNTTLQEAINATSPNPLVGNELFIRVTLNDVCKGTTVHYLKVKFNAPVTNATLDVKMLDISTNTSQQHRNWASGNLQNSTIATTQSNPISVGGNGGWISVKNNGGIVDQVSMRITDANSGQWIFNQNNNIYADILNSNPNQTSPGEFLINEMYRNEATNSSLYNTQLPLDPVQNDGYFRVNNNTNVTGKTFKLEGIASSSCSNVTPVTFTIFFKCMGRFVNGVWNTGQVNTKSAQSNTLNNSSVNSLTIINFNEKLVVEANLLENSTFSLFLTDLSGKVLIEEKSKSYSKGNFNISYNTAAFSSGVYILNTVLNGEVQSQKITLIH